jgi:glycosidase
MRFNFVITFILIIVSSCSKSESSSTSSDDTGENPIDKGISIYADANALNDVMLQSFWWDSFSDNLIGTNSFYSFMESKIIELSNAHFDLIWLPPPSEGDGMGYHPRQLFEFNTNFGTEAELSSVLNLLKNRQMHGMADLVLNHRVGTSTWTDFTNPSWSCNSICIDDEGYTDPNAFGTVPCGDLDEGEKWGGARDLNHKSTEVQNGIKEYMSRLKTLGFDSWRYDFVKGFPAKYVGEYNSASSPYFSVGEYWDGNAISIQSWIDGSSITLDGSSTASSPAFDFDLKYKLKSALIDKAYGILKSNNGSPIGISGIPGYGSKSVTFLDNHDTGCINRNDCDNLYSSSTGNIRLGYVYLLTHPGIPMIWGYHYFFQDSSGVLKNDINELIELRKAQDINANSLVEVLDTVDGANGYYAAKVDNKLIVKIGFGSYSPGENWVEEKTGSGYKIWISN